MKNDAIKFVKERIDQRKRVVLMVVTKTRGETPSKPGFNMAVDEDGKCAGTVGGGSAEHDLVEKAKRMLEEGREGSFVERQVLDGLCRDDTLDMICGGEQTVVLYACRDGDADGVDRIVRSFERGLGEAFIVGGGHVSLALSRVLATLDFRIIVFDDRDDVQTMEENTFADERIVVPFGEVHERIPEGDNSYVAIMTPSHRADELVLRNLVGGQYRYLGMMASPSKIREIFDHMRSDGFSKDQLEKVRTPIGLPINSHTPEEIAISIAAEMIEVRNSPGCDIV